MNTYLKSFHKSLFAGIREIMEEYGFFDHILSPSSDITERDFCMVVSDYFNRQKYDYKMEYSLGGKRIDFSVQPAKGRRHYIELKDCGLFETKYAKSLACCHEIEEGNYDPENPCSLTFVDNSRARSKTDWLEYFRQNERNEGRTLGGSEGLAKDVYKFYKLAGEGLLNRGDMCGCIAFVFWPQPFPAPGKSCFARIKKGAEAIEAGTRCLLKQLEGRTGMNDITYGIDTMELPEVSILNPYTSRVRQFEAAHIKLTTESISWVH